MFNIFKTINKLVILALIVTTLLRVLFKALGIEGFTYVPPADLLIKLTFAITDVYVEPINKIFIVIQGYLPYSTKNYFPIIEFKSQAYIFEWASLGGILLVFIIGIVIDHILSTIAFALKQNNEMSLEFQNDSESEES